jgi:hypothetical protein
VEVRFAPPFSDRDGVSAESHQDAEQCENEQRGEQQAEEKPATDRHDQAVAAAGMSPTELVGQA